MMPFPSFTLSPCLSVRLTVSETWFCQPSLVLAFGLEFGHRPALAATIDLIVASALATLERAGEQPPKPANDNWENRTSEVSPHGVG